MIRRIFLFDRAGLRDFPFLFHSWSPGRLVRGGFRRARTRRPEPHFVGVVLALGWTYGLGLGLALRRIWGRECGHCRSLDCDGGYRCGLLIGVSREAVAAL